MEGAMSLRFSTQAQSDLRRITSELAELQAQISSGVKAHDLTGFGGASTQLLTANGMKASFDARGSVIDQLGSRLEVQALALSQASSGARGLAQTIREALAADDGRGVATELQLAFSSIVSSLNQTWNGQPLFAGERLDGAPIKVTTLDQLAAATTPDDIFNESVRHQVAEISPGQPIDLAAKASEISQGLFDALRDLKLTVDAAGGSIGSPIDAAMRDQLMAIVGRLDAGAEAVTNEEGRTGRLQARIETERTRLTQNSDLLTKEIGEQADADLAQVSIRLNVLMAQYEAAAKTFTDLSKLTLLDYL